MPSAMIFCSCLAGAGSRVTAGRCYKKERQQVLVSCRDRSCAGTDDSTPSAPLAARQTFFDRRNLLITSTLTTGLLYGAFPTAAIAEAELPLPPQEGSCFECIGEVKGTLNTCDLDAPSCVSSQNDDESHFVAPWMYDGSPSEAADLLVSVATGGPYDSLLLDTPFGRSRSDVAGFILQGTFNVLTGQPPPTTRPQAQRQVGYVPFDGRLADRHTTEDGAEYVRVIFGASEAQSDPSRVVDAEFIFPSDDAVVLLRAASRVPPSDTTGTLKLSFTDSPLVFDRNYSRLLLERLRKALRFQIVPVITDFDPRFNNDKQLWFEKLLDPGNERYQQSGN